MLKIQTFKPENSFIKALIYGPSGAGKTTFSATAPKPIFASSEKGLMSICHLQPQFAEINSLQDLKDLYNFLKNEKHDFETCVIDSITEINDIIKSEIEARNKRNMQLQDWGILQKEIKDILRKFRDLPMHIIFLAQETTEKDEEKIVKYLPNDQMLEADQKLSEANVPMEDRWAIFLFADKKLLIKLLAERGTNLGDATMRNGYAGTLDGYKIYFSNNLPKTGNVRKVFFGQGKPLCFASDIHPDISMWGNMGKRTHSWIQSSLSLGMDLRYFSLMQNAL